MTKPYLIASALKRTMEKNKFTISQLADLTDISEDTIKAIRSGRTKNPGIQVIIRLADAMKCSIDELIGRDIDYSEDSQFLNKWHKMGNHGKKLVDAIADIEISAADTSPDKREITCLIPTSHIGDGINYHNVNLEKIEISSDMFQQADFCLRITSNALSPVYFYDDILAIEKRFPNNDEIGIFLNNNVGYIRRYAIANHHVQLLPLFPACKDLVVNGLKDYVCLGTVLGIVR